VRWDKKYLEWYPLSSLAIIVLSRPPRSGAVAAAFVLSPFFSCTPAPAVLPAPARTSASAASAAAAAAAAAVAVAAPIPLAIRLEYQGYLHRATGLHHCLRRSANHHQQPTSATLALSLHLSSCVFVLRQLPLLSFLSLSGADSAENMNIIRCLRIRRSAFPRTRASRTGSAEHVETRGNERMNSRIKSRVSRGRRSPTRNSGLPTSQAEGIFGNDTSRVYSRVACLSLFSL